MARKRMLSGELVLSKGFNRLSIEAQAMYARFLVSTDDFGVMYADADKISGQTNAPLALRETMADILEEYVAQGLGSIIEFRGEKFFVFNRDTFDRIQGFILNKRSKSEYLDLKNDDFEEIIDIKLKELRGSQGTSRNFQEIPRTFLSFDEKSVSVVESRKHTVESIKIGDRGLGEGDLDAPKRFVAPSEAECIAYFRDQAFHDPDTEASKFWNYYESNGWRVGKNPMKKWHSAAANWNKNAERYAATISSTKPTQRPTQRERAAHSLTADRFSAIGREAQERERLRNNAERAT